VTIEELLELVRKQEAQLKEIQAQIESLAKLHEEDQCWRRGNEKKV